MYASESPAPTSTSSTTPPQPLLLRQAPAHVAPQRHRVAGRGRARAARPPRRGRSHASRRARARSGRSRPTRRTRRSRTRRASSAARPAGTSSPITCARALGPEADDRPLGERAVDVRRARSSARLRGRRSAGSRAPPPARRGTGRRPSPSGSTPRSGAPGARSVAQDPERLEVRGLEQHLGRRVRDLGLLAAHDRGERDRALGVGDHQVVRLERDGRAVERPQLLARRARAARRSAPRRASSGRRRAAGCPRRA